MMEFLRGLSARLYRAYFSREFLIFFLFGGIAAAVNLVIGYALYERKIAGAMPYSMAVLIGSLLALVVNFLLNYFFNFQFRGRPALSQFWTFCTVAGFGVVLTALISSGLLLGFNTVFGEVIEVGAWSVSSRFAAHFIAVGAISVYSFAGHKLFTFNVGLRERIGRRFQTGRNR